MFGNRYKDALLFSFLPPGVCCRCLRRVGRDFSVFERTTNAVFSPGQHCVRWLGWLLVLGCCWGCKTNQLRPSNDRDWSPDQAVLSTAKIRGDAVTVRNIRNCKHLGEGEYVVDYYDRTFDLKQAQSVDFMVIPFTATPALAHTMLSFGFAGERYVDLSIEIRKEKGETYNPLKGAMRQYELMYVIADERDAIRLRTDIYKDQVYLYRMKASPEQVAELFVDVLRRANKLAKKPEFYDTLTNNCTNNLVEHVNKLRPETVPYTIDILLPGTADRLVYNLGLIDTTRSFAETKAAARINDLAAQYGDAPDFSTRIRTLTLASREPVGALR
jgi:hypothetical protein